MKKPRSVAGLVGGACDFLQAGVYCGINEGGATVTETPESASAIAEMGDFFELNPAMREQWPTWRLLALHQMRSTSTPEMYDFEVGAAREDFIERGLISNA
jgi:hypothetical protein